MDKKNKLLTIGQFALLHGINKKTLMWYDEIGLFKPAIVNSENGYRYYSYYQSSVLETILLLRELGVSINEIKNFMENRSAQAFKNLLDEKILELDKNIIHLNALRKTLSNYHQNMISLINMDLSDISIIEKEKHYLITIDIDNAISFEKETEIVTDETKKYNLHRLHDAVYGTMISADSLYSGDFNNYSKLFIEMPFSVKQTDLHIQPKGKYLRAFYKGDWNKIYSRYKEILVYAKEHSITFSGYSYETGINENVVDNIEDYIIKIEIPIQK